MAGMKMEIGMERRECYAWVGDGYCGYFHCWTYDNNKKVLAIIELFNGAVVYEKPEYLSFLDTSPSGLRHFDEAKKKYMIDNTNNDSIRQMIEKETTHICKVTECECIACKPGACGSRREKDETSN